MGWSSRSPEEERHRGLDRSDIDDELAFHLEGRADDLVAAGWSETEAHREAARRFGDRGEIRRECLAVRRQTLRRRAKERTMQALHLELKNAWRSLRRSPRFAIVVMLTLGVALGALTTIFSVVDGLLLRPLPFADPDRLVMVWQTDRRTGTTREASSTPDFVDVRARARWFDQVAAYQVSERNGIVAGARPTHLTVALVTANFLRTLGVEPLVGRAFGPSADGTGAERVALLTERGRRRLLAEDAEPLGAVVRVGGGEPFVVVGVVPGDLEIPGRDVDLLLPFGFGSSAEIRHTHGTSVVARLSPGATVAAAQRDMDELMDALEREYPESNTARGAFVEPVPDVLRGDMRPTLRLVMAAVVVLLALAFANVANLVLARAASRRGETHLRVALGASRSRLAARALLESTILLSGALALGLGLAMVGHRLLVRLAPGDLALDELTHLDLRVFAVSALVASAGALALGMVPLLRGDAGAPGSRRGTTDRLQIGGVSARGALVVVQVGLATLLLCGSGLLLVSLQRLTHVDRGFETAGVLRLDFRLPAERYNRDFSDYPRWMEVLRFNDELLRRARALPGVEAATLTTNHPLDAGFTNSFVIVGREDEAADQGELKTRLVSHGYFETNGVRAIAGRLLEPTDDIDHPLVLLVNEAAVERYFRDRPVLGERVRFWGIEREIVGVVANERMHGLDQQPPPAMYASLAQAPQVGRVTLMLRAAKDVEVLIDPLRGIFRELDPEVAVYDIATMDRTLADSYRRQTFASLCLGLFAAVAVLLAVLGVYSVLTYLAAQRSREVGVRLALGATRAEIVRLVMSRGLLTVGAGLLLGLAAAVASSSALRSLLYEVSPTEPWLLGLVVVLLLGASAAACFVPARRASRTDPARTLAAE